MLIQDLQYVKLYIYVLIAIYNIYNNLIYLQEYSFRLLREKSQIKTLYVSLLLDEMSIKSQLVWDGNLNKFTGYVNIGVDSC